MATLLLAQTEKLVPQPHPEVAFGFLILKAAPISSLVKSISAPFRNSRLISSMTTLAPSRSTTRSSGFASGAKSNL